ncbi:protein-export membrane protein SecD [Glaesserella parasuis 12939]|uniref:Protein translocase subunit SecD n=3 Tax=Glaesserella parasuis TaxID=738 RepID=B8F5J0_GLAP5|nr:preprotein translocase subunit SecD [Glaesserella parasuis SH0165]ATW43639.1 protein-export membrane protein SecD [Glaesserella parasuis D74]EQA01714.1 protein-export membrane protein SecD [Glaesserella parasuis SW114]EQA05762.1 protein-export membrane protein SecD [Glaesserella parasuis 12939]EQA12334.1 protein-export membrane protein SecD [Glaesserella parasuis H465]KDB48711.1 preprotein translocase subunit SecD [Glaesserella parasuis HPS11]KDB49200.1 preprotein translocase subunit SecD 
MVILVVAIGILYALPNLYGEDPSVQVSGTRGQQASAETLTQVQSALASLNITPKAMNLENGSILVRLNKDEEQLPAKEKIAEVLGNNYSVALNLAPATPEWLTSIGGEPMKRGLDLRGGVRFLMEVDMNTALAKQQDQLQDTLRNDFRKEKWQYKAVKKAENFATDVEFNDTDTADKAVRYIRRTNPNLEATYISPTVVRFAQSAQGLATSRDLAIEQNLSILRKRVEELGVSEPTIQRQGADRIVVELPGVQDTARAKEILGATATLEFRLVNGNANLESAARGIVPADSEIKYSRDGMPTVLYRKTILGGEHIINATSGKDERGLPNVSINLDAQGGDLMSNATKSAVGKPMATLYSEFKDSGRRDANGKVILEKHEEVINVATINSRLGSSFQITGINSAAEAQNLAVLLRSGALIAPIVIVEERTIGASLGADNVAQGMDASMLGLGLTILFCVVYYKVFGLFATAALLANLVLTIGLMSLIGATLTMPGIAGIVLAVGMSIDANVLIYERIKEEIRNGRSIQQAIHEGYNGAFTSIFDSNLTTILVAIILYAVGTGPVKGFAVTLALGVMISMFTAITGTRMLVNLVYGGKRVKKLWI